MGLVYSSVLQSLTDNFEKLQKDFTYAILIIVYLFITEFLPDYLALDYQFMMFHIAENEETGENGDVKI